MARPKRKRLEFNEKSLNDLLQEIYNDSHNNMAVIKRLFTKWENKIKESNDISMLGDQIIKLLSAEAKNQDHKITLLKQLKEVIYKDTPKKDKDNNSDYNKSFNSKNRNDLIELVRETRNNE